MNDQSQKPVQCTLAFPFREGKILLGMGTRGVNKNRWNGFGGKMDVGDVSLAACAVRELQEEVGLTSDEKDLRYHGSVTFHWGMFRCAVCKVSAGAHVLAGAVARG